MARSRTDREPDGLRRRAQVIRGVQAGLDGGAGSLAWASTGASRTRRGEAGLGNACCGVSDRRAWQPPAGKHP